MNANITVQGFAPDPELVALVTAAVNLARYERGRETSSQEQLLVGALVRALVPYEDLTGE